MLRIVGIQRAEYPEREFILLQNQGHQRLTPKGHVILSEEAVIGISRFGIHIFTEQEWIMPGQFLMLCTGFGESKWVRSQDQSLLLQVFMGRTENVWPASVGPIHVLATKHSFIERPVAQVVRV